MASSTEGGRRDDAPLALIERLDRDGHVLQSTPVYRWPFVIGRAFDTDLVLDDPHVAPIHVLLDEVGGAVQLSVGQTINGAMVGARHLQAGQRTELDVAQTWRVGDTRLRVRRASDPLAPELPLARHLALSATTPAVGLGKSLIPWLLAVLLVLLGQQWLDNDPGTPASSYLSLTLTMLTAVSLWAMLWALGSKLFQGRLDYLLHLGLALRYSLIWMLAATALPLLAFISGWPILSRVADAVGMLVMCALMWAHLSLILPGHRRGLSISLVSLYVSAVGLNVWLNEQRTGRVFSELYATALPPPAWRLAPMQPTASLIEDARKLKSRLDHQAHEDDGDEVVDTSEE
jgi:hypothetical protein